ncbi:MAG: acyl-CoA dehydrogenase family protein [Actinobacteria bacterium]|nr:acyl-CoA dehydrogenase family protein [Actinomycetota bacterium]
MSVNAESSLEEQKRLIDSKINALLDRFDIQNTKPPELWKAQYELGLAWIHFPVGLGGLSLSPALMDYSANVLYKSGVPSNFHRNPIGIGMAAPTLLTWASRELTQQLLPPMFSCEEIWCQLFSEPGAGSDVASVSTKATRYGEQWIINGQKVWTTLAHVARWGMLLARSDSTGAKHAGLTYFVVDMHSPGVEVRPLRQLTGEAEFNEVYFTDVQIPDSFRLGEVNGGWKVAITTLMNERSALGGQMSEQGHGPIEDAIKLYKKSKYRLPSQRDQLVQLWIEAEVNRLTAIRASQMRISGNPGPEGSVTKLASAELNKKIYDFCYSLLGAEATLYSGYQMKRPETAGIERSQTETDIAKAYLRSRANSIEGGTSEIMRNILGERVLGLPGEPRVDK